MLVLRETVGAQDFAISGAERLPTLGRSTGSLSYLDFGVRGGLPSHEIQKKRVHSNEFERTLTKGGMNGRPWETAVMRTHLGHCPSTIKLYSRHRANAALCQNTLVLKGFHSKLTNQASQNESIVLIRDYGRSGDICGLVTAF